MATSFARIGARLAGLCLALASALAAPSTHAAPDAASTPVLLRASDTDKGMFGFTPLPTTREPVPVVYLHGINGRPEHGCPWFRPGATEIGILLCPEGVVRGPGGTASWGGDPITQSTAVTRAIKIAEANGATAEPGVLIGFSQGGYAALNVVQSHRATFRGLVLIAAFQTHPSGQMLRDAGVERVALAAGKYDMAHAPLIQDVKRLQSEGIDARFFDLGRVGHTYAAEDPRVLRDAIAWASGRQ